MSARNFALEKSVKSKIILIPLLVVAVLCIIGGAFLAGFTIGNTTPALLGDNNQPVFPSFGEIIPFNPQPSTGEVDQLAEQAGTPDDLNVLFEPFWEAWKIVHDEYVDQPIDDTLLLQGAIQGMLDSLGDPYTSYLDPNTYFQLDSQLEGGYQGIGAWVDTDSEFLTIISPMPDSPAEKAGLEPGDEIIAIDGEDMTGIDGNLVIRRVLGPAGSSVLLTIRRESLPDPFDVEIIRAEIVIPSVRSEMLENSVGYIQLFQFGNDTDTDLRAAIRELEDDGAQSLILDLRYNGGGLLTSSIDVASEFISSGVILYQEYGDGSRDTHRAKPGGLATEIPLIVLINEGSASASEIVAGAIQDYERGLIVGTTSFGKGSVQLPIKLSNDQGAVRVTIARWLTPDERQIAGVGIEPDVTVELTEEAIAAEQDTQLEKALELLSE
jgi:carboxyl-terminal processing protease